jgi:SAM-dependent methyltransferase
VADSRALKTAEAHARLWGAKARDWSELQEPFFLHVYEAVFDRAGPGAAMSYLDVGCGAGLAAQCAARRGAKISGIDAAPDMLAIARERVPGGEFRLGDIEELPFSDRSFDVVTGFNSFQFAGSPEVALREACRVVKSSGVVVIVTWAKPEGMQAALLVYALKPLLPPVPRGAPGPFALSDESQLRSIAERAGLTPFDAFEIAAPWSYPDHATAMRALASPGGAVKAAELAGAAAVDRAHADAIAPFRSSDGSYRVEARFRCLFTRPARSTR